jgi:hypothetical protein
MLGNNEDAIQQAMSALSTDKMYNTPTTTREQKAGRLVELVKERGGTITIQQALTRLQTPAAGQQTSFNGYTDAPPPKTGAPKVSVDPRVAAEQQKAMSTGRPTTTVPFGYSQAEQDKLKKAAMYTHY